MIAFEIIYFIVLVLILLGVSLFDILKGEIPNSLSLSLFVLNLIYFIVKSINNSLWFIPLIASIGLFFVFFIIYLISKENIVGGGDVKIICSSILTLTTYDLMFNYCFYWCLFTLIGYVIVSIKDRKKDTKYLKAGPYLSLSLLCAILPLNLPYIIIIALIFTYTLFILTNTLFLKDVIYNNEKITKLLKN